MRTLRLYGPMLLLLLWAAVFLICDDTLVVATAFVTVAWSVWIHLGEASQRWSR